jgi:hypothetical protein
MAVAFIMDFAGSNAAQYDAVVEKMALGDRLPAGAMFHAAGPTDTGWRVCDVWETAEAFQQFADAKIGPISSEVGMPAPQVRAFEAADVRRGGSAPVTFVQVVAIAGMDGEGFRALDERVLGPEHQVPADCVFHVNGKLGDGWAVLDYWSSKDVRDEFMQSKVGPAVQALGVEAEPAIEELEVHNTLTEPAEHPAGV